MLTQRQTEVFDFIREEQTRTGRVPSTREIQTHFGYASQTSVVDILRALEKKGVINRDPARKGVLQIAGFSIRKIIHIPLFGSIPAGLPAHQVQEPDESLAVDLEWLQLPRGSKVFALKVTGDSMVGAGIFHGDTVVLKHKEPRHGHIVAALIDGEVTLKRYLVENGQPYLKAENPAYPDLLPAQELIIQGVQIALFRLNQ
ncbi:MAG TPA: transcriptional repressor LexA [Chthoniobacterales bacterium]|jgi:repressor LexA